MIMGIDEILPKRSEPLPLIHGGMTQGEIGLLKDAIKLLKPFGMTGNFKIVTNGYGQIKHVYHDGYYYDYHMFRNELIAKLAVTELELKTLTFLRIVK